MVKVTVTGGEEEPKRRGNTIAPLVLNDLPKMQEGPDLDFKRSIEIDKRELKARLLDDVVAFLNRGPSRIVIGVQEKDGRFDALRPIPGNADQLSLRLQTLIQDISVLLSA
jgi:predicted HTH transcriptional regulator